MRGFVRLFGTRVPARAYSVHGLLERVAVRSGRRSGRNVSNDPLYVTPTAGSGQSILPLGTICITAYTMAYTQQLKLRCVGALAAARAAAHTAPPQGPATHHSYRFLLVA